MVKNKEPIEVIWEYEPSPDSERRLQQAFDMLIDRIAIDPEPVKGIKTRGINGRKPTVKKASDSGL
jgi:hypothetical protein